MAGRLSLALMSSSVFPAGLIGNLSAGLEAPQEKSMLAKPARGGYLWSPKTKSFYNERVLVRQK